MQCIRIPLARTEHLCRSCYEYAHNSKVQNNYLEYSIMVTETNLKSSLAEIKSELILLLSLTYFQST